MRLSLPLFANPLKWNQSQKRNNINEIDLAWQSILDFMGTQAHPSSEGGKNSSAISWDMFKNKRLFFKESTQRNAE